MTQWQGHVQAGFGAAVFGILALTMPLAAQAEGIDHLPGLPAPIKDADYRPVDPAEAALGQLLFYDPILSGNRNISCATCHHPDFATGDGVSLSLGEGGVGLGPDRRPSQDNRPEQRIPRHAQALFNLGAHEFTVLFHDGRIEVDASKPSGLRTPLDEDMVQGFDTLLSAQTMFPVLSADEMAGHYGENEVSLAVRQGRLTGTGGAWDLIAARVRDIPAYQDQFAAVYPDVAAGRPLGFTDISNAIGAFIELEWRADQSAFDAWLRGQGGLTAVAERGATLFYGEAQCATCHSGPFQTDHGFHAMGQPQFGPGKAARFESHANDLGRMRVTGRAEDAYAFRTPSLRNVAETAPYGHTGAFATLGGFLRHHADPVAGLDTYDRDRAILPPLPGVQDWRVLDDPATVAPIAVAAGGRAPLRLSDDDIAALEAFLQSLTDLSSINGRLGIPERVPSGLPVER